MSNEITDNCRRKLTELEEKIKQLNSQKSILLHISTEIDKNTNAKLNSLFYGTDLKDEISYLNDWIEFYSKDAEKYRLKLKKSEQTAVKDERLIEPAEKAKEKKILNIIYNYFNKLKQQKILFKYFIPFFIILLIIAGLFLLKPSITGHAVLSKETTYSKSLNLRMNESGNYTWVPDNKGKLTSIKATGSIAGNGTAKIYIEKDGKRYLIFDNRHAK